MHTSMNFYKMNTFVSLLFDVLLDLMHQDHHSVGARLCRHQCLRLNPALHFPSDVTSEKLFNLSRYQLSHCSMVAISSIMKVK